MTTHDDPGWGLTPPPPTPPKKSDKKRPFYIAGGSALVAIALVLAIVFAAGGGTKAKSGTPGEVILDPASANGNNPYMASVAAGLPASTPHLTVPTTAPPTSTTRGGAIGIETQAASTPGLYGGTENQSSCNRDQMITFLAQNPAKAAAWVAALNADPTLRWSGGTQVSASQIAQYLGELTPVLLRTDTRVTNHGFAGGHFTTLQSVLQAGTAVLVDTYGVPRARCACGNPLSPPQAVQATPTYTGPAWPSFRPTSVIAVAPAPTIINIFVLIDPVTGTAFGRPQGSTGERDGPPPVPGTPTPNSTTTTTPRTTTTTTNTTVPITTPVTGPNGQRLGTGAVQVTLTWSTVADLDLHVLEPDGTEIYYGNKTANDGGTLDVDSNGGCQNLTTSPVENVYWSNPPPAGTYTARPTYYGECGGSGSGPQSFTLTVKINGQVVLQRQGTLNAAGTSQDIPYTVG